MTNVVEVSTPATPKKKQKRGTGRKYVNRYPQRDRAIALFKEQLVKGGTKSIEAILLEAGYAPATAKQQAHTMAGIRAELSPFIERMEKLRENAIERAEKTVNKASHAEAVMTVDKLTKNIQLLSGRRTSNGGLSAEDMETIEEMING